jgi:quercetin dioxygenase-like cupin family protein
MTTLTFDAFKAQKLAEGYDEVLLREWAPNLVNEPHTHPFDTHAFVAQGEFWLTVNGQTTHYVAGSTFELARGIPHAERYGTEGAVFWAARINPA